MASTVNFPYYFSPPPPHVTPPPPFHPVPPPPFHPVQPPPFHPATPPPFHPVIPPPPPPPSSPDNGPTVIIIVVSFGCIFFLALCFFALCCLIKKRKKRTVQELETIHVDEHLKVKEAIVEGPHGPQSVVLSVEDDKHVEELINKRTVSAKSGEINATGDVEVGKSSSNPSVGDTHHHIKHKP